MFFLRVLHQNIPEVKFISQQFIYNYKGNLRQTH